MRKLTGFTALCVFCATVLLLPVAQASDGSTSHAKAPEAVFEPFPASPDLSLDTALRIQSFAAGSARVVQVSDREGAVLGGYLTREHHTEPLPLGDRPQIMTVLAPPGEGISVFDVGPEPVPCPCRSSLAYQDEQMRIVALFDKDDAPVQLVQMSHHPAQN